MDQQIPEQPTQSLNVPPATTPNNTTQNNNPLIIGIIVLILMLSGGLLYVFMSWKATVQPTPSSNRIPSPILSAGVEESIAAPTLIPTNAVQTLNKEDQELQNISLENDTKEFDELNADLQAL